MALAKQVGANIKAARKAKSWSLERLAAKIDPPTSYQHLSRLEKGGDALTLEWVEKIAKALGVDPIELLVGPQSGISAPADSIPLLNELTATEYARSLATVALKVHNPDENTVQLVALALQGLLRTISRNPEAATDAALARIAADAVGSQYVPAAS
jgi:transcriptional regulator with XRE-family HTH domain